MAQLPQGRLILVTCADMGRLDLVLRAAMRRLPPRHAAVLLEPVGTATLPAGGGERLKASAFRAVAESSGLVLEWCEAGRKFGYGSGLLIHLLAGTTVVVAARAGCGLEAKARAICDQVTIVHLEPGTEALRSALSRQSCDFRLRDVGNAASTIAVMTAMLQSLLPCPAAAVPASAAEATVLAGHSTRPRMQAARPERRVAAAQLLEAPGRALKPQARTASAT